MACWKKALAVLGIAICSGMFLGSTYGSIIITSAFYGSYVDNDLQFQSQTGSSLNGGIVFASIPDISSSFSYSVSDSGFFLQTNLQRDGLEFHRAWASSNIHFTPQNDVAFTFNGSFTNLDGWGVVQSSIDEILEDGVASIQMTSLSNDGYWSFSIVPTSGIFQAGHNYQFTSSFYTWVWPNNVDDGSTATGFLSLQLVSVPEPPSLLSLIIFGTIGLFRRRVTFRSRGR